MGETSVPASATIYDRILRRIQTQLANRVKIPVEIRLWGDRVYRFGEGEPAVDILVRDRKGLAALGRLDELATGGRLPGERPAAPIMDRAPVTVPLQTGLKVVDALIPIGRGQRELILGDWQTGMTALDIDTILNQRGKDVLCVYCAIGQRASSRWPRPWPSCANGVCWNTAWWW